MFNIFVLSSLLGEVNQAANGVLANCSSLTAEPNPTASNAVYRKIALVHVVLFPVIIFEAKERKRPKFMPYFNFSCNKEACMTVSVCITCLVTISRSMSGPEGRHC